MAKENNNYRILMISNEKNLINKLSIVFESSKYTFELVREPLEGLRKVREINYDLVIINFDFSKEILKTLINKIRFFDAFAYIMLVCNYDNMEDTLNVVKNFDIQSYYNKDDDIKQFIILVNLICNSIYEFNRINLDLDNYDNEYKSPYLSTVQILRNIVEYKDMYTIRHSFRVSKYATLIGKYMKLSRNDIKTLKVGSMFHDIGKISTPNNILLKNSSLNSNEYLQIKAHPLVGSHILFPTRIYDKAIPIVKFHHERFDGNGYPAKLEGESIPFLTRIVTVADTFDAMTSKRTYRDSLPLDTVISEFKKNRGTQFDPEITDVFLDILDNHYNEIEKIQKNGRWGRSFYPSK